MSEIDDLDGEDGGGDVAPTDTLGAVAGSQSIACLSCGGALGGVFCPFCGQKNDDMRRSVFLLARNFLEDTFSFDSRMWRTLGLMAVAPGVVPKYYAHGKRSRFTPPVRLFLVVSFLFFLTIAVTNTLFVAVDVVFKDAAEASAEAPKPTSSVIVGEGLDGKCGFQGKLRFFIKESDLDIDTSRIDACLSGIKSAVRQEVEDPEASDQFEVDLGGGSAEDAIALTERIFGGVSWAVANPRAFNSAVNSWLPRIMFLMTPVLALILTVFIRGPDALIFDHLVLSLYTHAAGFVIVGGCLILAQLGAPYMGVAAFAGVALYYLAALKRAYGRGWIKTGWTTLASGFFYLVILLMVMLTIVSNIIWRATA